LLVTLIMALSFRSLRGWMQNLFSVTLT